MIHSYLLSVDLTRVRTIVPVARARASAEAHVDGCGDVPVLDPALPAVDSAVRRDAQRHVERAEASPA